MASIIPFCECLREVRRAPSTAANVACDDALGCPPPPGHRHLPNVQSPLGVPRGLECADNFPSSAPPHRQSPLRSSDSSRRWQRRRISRYVHVRYSAARSLTLCRSSARGAGIVSGSSKMRRVSVTNGLTFSPPLIVFFSSNAASEGQAFQVQHVSQTSQHCGWSRCAHSASPQTRARPVSAHPPVFLLPVY